MKLSDLPPQASWHHRGLQTGYEVVFATALATGHRLRGATTAVEAGEAWSVSYVIEVDRHWRTQRADASSQTHDSERRVTILRSDTGHWSVDGRSQPKLDGCVDVDFESSGATNTLPIHRIRFEPGTPVQVPAAFVRLNLRVERMEQEYTLTGDADGRLSFHYESSTFGVACELIADTAGLMLHYPNIAVRDR